MPGSHGWAVLQEKMYVHDGEALLGHLEGVDDRNGVASEGVQTGGSRLARYWLQEARTNRCGGAYL